jgi:hypothetical protein
MNVPPDRTGRIERVLMLTGPAFLAFLVAQVPVMMGGYLLFERVVGEGSGGLRLVRPLLLVASGVLLQLAAVGSVSGGTYRHRMSLVFFSVALGILAIGLTSL